MNGSLLALKSTVGGIIKKSLLGDFCVCEVFRMLVRK